MVHDHIWAAAHADPRAWLWVGCLEARLDRQLHWGDFTAAGVNDVTIKPTPRFAWSWRTDRLLDSLTAHTEMTLGAMHA